MHKQTTSSFFQPKLRLALKGYSRQRLLSDIGAGITVGAVALPLAMAFAIASGLKPEAGLFTAVIAGFLISALGGSRVQIGGPAGAFIVIIYGIVERYGLANLIIATAMSGIMLFALGFFRLGSLIRFIPVAVVIGFTNGIAVLIALSQIKEFFGLNISKMPADFWGMLHALVGALGSLNHWATAVATISLLLIMAWQTGLPYISQKIPSLSRLSLIPSSVVVMVLATAMVFYFQLPVETIGSKFGSVPSSLPQLVLPGFEWATARFLFIPAITLALLGAIESLLCARVADNMIDDRHDPNQELMAQGIANFVTPFFGGMPATGTLARTVTNVKHGASSPIAGMVHAVTLLLVMLLAAPLAKHIPLASMAAILLVVAWKMGEWRAFTHLRQFRMPYRITLLAVFFLTVVFDLTIAVEVGLVAACLTFIYRISSLSRSELVNSIDQPLLREQAGRVEAYRLYGALFFGAVKLIEDIEDKLPHHAVVLDLKNVIYIDSSGADALANLARKCQKSKVHLIVCGLALQPQDILLRSGFSDLLAPEDLQPDLRCGLQKATA